MAMSWPILSIIFAYSLYLYVSHDCPSIANRLSFVFAALGFTVLACMISIQLAVKFGTEEYLINTPGKEEQMKLMRHSLRFVDLGIDVAWDLLIGTSLIFLFAAIKGHSQFRLAWALPPLVLGILLMVLNVYTFPKPPNTAGFFDVGPFIGLYIIAISVKLILIGRNNKRQAEII